MTTYVLDIKHEIRVSPNNYTDIIYHFQIDINGNVCIKQGSKDGYYRDCDCITINDNIPIPSYLIKSIELLLMGITLNNEERYKKELLCGGIPRRLYGGTPISNSLYERHFELIRDTIIRIKTSLKEITENPKEHLDLEQQINAYIAKSKLQQEHILEFEKKMENLQTAYFDVLNDNKKN